MSEKTFPFKVGTFKCIVVKDGIHAYPYPAQNVFINFFVNAPKEDLEQTLRQHGLNPEGWKEYVSPYVSLVINTGDELILVDTGAGAMSPTTGKLIQNLQSEGLAPEDFDKVILTHAHPDHIGGNLDSQGKPAFPNARYVISKTEWDFWMHKADAELKIPEEAKKRQINVARYNLLPIKDQVDLVGETEVVPGISLIEASGHTLGQMVVAVTSLGEKLLCLSDTVLHPIHLERPEWYSSVEVAPQKIVSKRQKLLSKVASDKTLVQVFHFPFPGLGYIVQKGERWQWQPIETTG